MDFQSNLQGLGQGQRETVTLRVVVRTLGLETFIQKYSRFVKDDRIFIFTKSSQPTGTHVRFTLELTDGKPLISGEGTVTRVRGETGDPSKPPGMELRFRTVDEPSQRIVEFMLAERAMQEAAKKSLASTTPDAPPVRQPTLPALPTTASVPNLDPGKLPIARKAPIATEMSRASTSVSPVFSPPSPVFPGPPADSMSPAPIDEISHNFPTIDAPPAFAESFRKERRDGLVPANPFSEVSDAAIEYFVEWSLERSTAPHDETEEPARATFGNVKMVSPSIELEAAKLTGSPRSRLPSFWFGLALGVILGNVGHFIWSRCTFSSSSSVPSPASPAARREPLTSPPAPAPVAATPKTAPEPDKTAATSPGLVELAVASRPSGATVVIDGKESGSTPLKTQVSAGHHQLDLILDRYADTSQTVEAPGSVSVVMKRPHAKLTIESSPAGAEVLIAGELRGHAPLSVGLPAFENYDVQVQVAGGKTWKRRIYLKAPATKVLAQLAPPTKAAPYLAPRGRVTGIR